MTYIVGDLAGQYTVSIPTQTDEANADKVASYEQTNKNRKHGRETVAYSIRRLDSPYLNTTCKDLS